MHKFQIKAFQVLSLCFTPILVMLTLTTVASLIGVQAFVREVKTISKNNELLELSYSLSRVHNLRHKSFVHSTDEGIRAPEIEYYQFVTDETRILNELSKKQVKITNDLEKTLEEQYRTEEELSESIFMLNASQSASLKNNYIEIHEQANQKINDIINTIFVDNLYPNTKKLSETVTTLRLATIFMLVLGIAINILTYTLTKRYILQPIVAIKSDLTKHVPGKKVSLLHRQFDYIEISHIKNNLSEITQQYEEQLEKYTQKITELEKQLTQKGEALRNLKMSIVEKELKTHKNASKELE